ncbi:MAG: hypothetical protein JRJ75_11280 [Deltaproteobacteria bacterium]|nr:hypothetical protein [Deltaproteobacteria bacterium]MBW1929222.1 hypothetical protein [Deltaproteobacteria bacterium]MBW2025243.1 hypothetical protein [Deltaproteobacteria bacterium]
MTSYFIVTSHGWSASNWLAYVLNHHQDIICTHSARNILASKKDMNSDENLRKNIKNLHQGYLLRQNRSLDRCYDEIEKNGKAKCYGSVHVYRMRDLPVLYEKYGAPKREYSVLNLIRHPVSLVWSGYGQFRELFRYDLNELYWTSGKILKTAKDFVFDLAEEYDLYIGDLENLAFIGASAVLGSLRLDFDAEEKLGELPGIYFLGHIKMEDITVSPETLSNVIQILSHQELDADDNYLRTVYSMGIVNQHKNDPNKHNAREKYLKFTDWQKKVFLYFMNLYDLVKPYQRLGYDLSFL